jgi:hypothetical protein
MGFFDLFKRKKTEQPKVEESKPVESVAQPVVDPATEPQPEEPKVEVNEEYVVTTTEDIVVSEQEVSTPEPAPA